MSEDDREQRQKDKPFLGPHSIFYTKINYLRDYIHVRKIASQ
jgi:hypothetical protein